MTITIKMLTPEYLDDVMAIAKALPAWFDADARIRAMPVDIRYQDGFVADIGGEIVGFISFYISEGRVNIGWLGVRPAYHRQGIGAELVKAAGSYCQLKGIQELSVMTLGESVDYEPYETTRAFYHKMGFRVYLRAQTDNPGCPEEIRLKKIIET